MAAASWSPGFGASAGGNWLLFRNWKCGDFQCCHLSPARQLACHYRHVELPGSSLPAATRTGRPGGVARTWHMAPKNSFESNTNLRVLVCIGFKWIMFASANLQSKRTSSLWYEDFWWNSWLTLLSQNFFTIPEQSWTKESHLVTKTDFHWTVDILSFKYHVGINRQSSILT